MNSSLAGFAGDGRNGRQTWWLGSIVMLIVFLVLYFVSSAILVTGLVAPMDPQKNAVPGYVEAVLSKMAWQQFFNLAIVGWPLTTLMSQRLNDRDRPTWLKWFFWIPTLLSSLLAVSGMSFAMAVTGNGVMTPVATPLATLVTVVALIFGFWALIEMGLLRGTDGPNQYGANPVE